MSKFKAGDKIKFLDTDRNLGYKKDDTATIMSINQFGKGSHFVNTEKLNNYNHSEHNGNGLIVSERYLELLTPTIVKGRWSLADTDYLHLKYHRNTISEISKHLNRPYHSVASKAHSEGLSTGGYKHFNENDIRIIHHGYIDGLSITEMATKLHRSKSSIDGKLRKLKALPSFPLLSTKEIK